MLFSFSDIYQFVFEAIKIFTGGVLEGTIPLSLRRLRTTDSNLSSIKSDLFCTYKERNAFTSSFNFAMWCTFRSALCELAIVIMARAEKNKIKRHFLKAPSLTKKVPFKMLYIMFFIFFLYIFLAILSLALLALLLILISSSW